ACIEEIVARHPDQTVAVFAHGAILRTILTAALHMDLQYVWTIRQFNTAVNIVTYTEHGTTVELINGTGHLKYTQEPVD
ncbi:histidine phosphatase family protein, partial [Mitsuokella multacida]